MTTHDITPPRTGTRFALILAAVQIGGALLLTLARKQGAIDAETTTRLAMVLVGLYIAAWGNTLPKLLSGPAPTSVADATARQAVQRVAGWAMTLLGVVFAAFYAFTPNHIATVGAVTAGIAAITLVSWYTIQQGRKARR